MSTKPGIRESAYFNGFLFTRSPTAVNITLESAETRQRAIDGTLHVHRARPFTGAPIRYTKANVSLSWQSLTGNDIDQINDLIAWGGPVEFTVWRPITEAFQIRSTASGLLQRKNATTQASPLPPNAAALYAATCWQGGVQKQLTLSSPNADARTPWSSSDATTGVVVVRYYPLFSLYVAEGQPSFSIPQLQGQTLRLEER